MALLRLPVSMLLASFIILLLNENTSSNPAPSKSHDPSLSKSHDPLLSKSHDLALDVSPPSKTQKHRRVKRDLEYGAADKVKETLDLAQQITSTSVELASMFKSLSTFGKMLPGFVGVAFSVVNTALALTDQDDTLAQLKREFKEVNRKLDTLSVKIGDLFVEVSWANYASVYGQYEGAIKTTWKRYEKFLDRIQKGADLSKQRRQASMFIREYELLHTEASVNNFYHALTVGGVVSLNKNLNQMLAEKYKCDVRQMQKYNKHFSSLLFKGMVVNQLYWSLIGLNEAGKEVELQEKLQEVYDAQKTAIKTCVKNSKESMKTDVKETALAMDPGNKEAIGDAVKKFLDTKYFWYNWVVLVYLNYYRDRDYHKIHEMQDIVVGDLTVSVGFTRKAKGGAGGGGGEEEEVKKNAKECLGEETYFGYLGHPWPKRRRTTCVTASWRVQNCNVEVNGVPTKDLVKMMHSTYYTYHYETPKPMISYGCDIPQFPYNSEHVYQLSVFYSPLVSVCPPGACANEAACEPLFDSNEHLCECTKGYHGDRCEQEIKMMELPAINESLIHHPRSRHLPTHLL